MLLGLVTILGFALGSMGMQDELIAWVAGYFPRSGDMVTANALHAVKAREEMNELIAKRVDNRRA